MSNALELALMAANALSRKEKCALLAKLNSPAPTAESVNRVLRRKDAAARFGVSLRTVDEWTKQGLLRKVFLPGRKRGCGFRLSDIEALIK